MIFNQDNSDLVGALNLLKNRRFVFISDSYGVGANNWVSQLITALGLTENTNAFNVSASSTGFLGDPNLSGDYTWKTLLTNNLNNISDRDTITDIIVCGGTNDISYSYADLLTAMGAFRNYVNANFPNAKISVGFIGRKNAVAGITNYATCANYYAEIAPKRGMVYIPFSECCWGCANNFRDTWHPNDNGNALISSAILSYIQTGVASAFSFKQYVTPTKTGITANVTSALTNFISQTATNGLMYIGTTDILTLAMTATTIVCNDNWQELFEIPNAIAVGNGETIVGGYMSIYDSANGNYPSIPCIYRYYDSKLWVKIPWKGYTGTNNFSASTTQIKFAIPMIGMPMKGN